HAACRAGAPHHKAPLVRGHRRYAPGGPERAGQALNGRAKCAGHGESLGPRLVARLKALKFRSRSMAVEEPPFLLISLAPARALPLNPVTARTSAVRHHPHFRDDTLKADPFCCGEELGAIGEVLGVAQPAILHLQHQLLELALAI